MYTILILISDGLYKASYSLRPGNHILQDQSSKENRQFVFPFSTYFIEK